MEALHSSETLMPTYKSTQNYKSGRFTVRVYFLKIKFAFWILKIYKMLGNIRYGFETNS
jgi:hypothetical protein